MWRGHFARRVRVPVRAKLGKRRTGILEGLALGWKVRRILRTKEVSNRIKQILELNEEVLREMYTRTGIMNRHMDKELVQGLRKSILSAKERLISLITKM